MPTAWRIVKSTRSGGAFDGEGARVYGGRWNSVGTPVVYAAQSESLAALELLVHIQRSAVLLSYSSIAVSFDARLVETLPASRLPDAWRNYPAPAAIAQLGDRWAAELRSAVLQVPSAIVPNEWNYVLNPRHPDFSEIEIGEAQPFPIDPRLG